MGKDVLDRRREQSPIGGRGSIGQTGWLGAPRPGRQRAHAAEQSLGRTPHQQHIAAIARPEDRAVSRWPRGLGRLDRIMLLIARRIRRASFTQRAQQAFGSARGTDRGAQIHHRLGEIAGALGRRQRRRGRADRRFVLQPEQSRDNALDIGVDYGGGLVERDRGDRSGGIVADSGQRAQLGLGARKGAAMRCDHRASASDEIARPGIIAEPRPCCHDVSLVRPGQTGEIGPARDPGGEARADRCDTGLLQHHFGQPDAIGIGALARPGAPWQRAAMRVVPAQQCRRDETGQGWCGRKLGGHPAAMAWMTE